MNIFMTISDGAAASVAIILNYRPWVPGNDPWSFNGPGILGVTPIDFAYVKAAGQANLFANFSGSNGILITLQGFGGLSHDWTKGDTGVGLYNGPPGTLGQAGAQGWIQWSIDDIQ